MNILFNIAGVRVKHLSELENLKKLDNQSPELKASLRRLEESVATIWMDWAQSYLNSQPITYDEKKQVMQRWKEQLLEQ